eukprot:11588659-Prorocentrum_lima.AAC.1
MAPSWTSCADKPCRALARSLGLLWPLWCELWSGPSWSCSLGTKASLSSECEKLRVLRPRVLLSAWAVT